jgi:hypothetical protein
MPGTFHPLALRLKTVPAGPEEGDGVLTVCAPADGATRTRKEAIPVTAAARGRVIL